MEPITMGIMGATALASLLSSLFGKKEAKQEQYPTLGPEQIAAQDAVLKQVLSGLSSGPQGPYSFAPIRQAAESQFHQRTIPSIAQRFAGADAQRGSGFQQALGMAGAGLGEGLAGQESQFNQQYLANLMHMLQLGLQPRFGTTYSPEGTNTFGNAMNALSTVGGQLGSYYQGKENISELAKMLAPQGQQSGMAPDYAAMNINDLMKSFKNLTPKFSSAYINPNQGSPLMNVWRQ